MDNRISVEMREKLYDEIWSEAMSKVAPRYGVSDVTLRKKCALWGIPIPSSEYRRRVVLGQNPKRTPLPELSKETKKYVYGYSMKLVDLKELKEEELYSEEPLFAISEFTREKIIKSRDSIAVPNNKNELSSISRERLKAYEEDRKCRNAGAYQRLFLICETLISAIDDLEGKGFIYQADMLYIVLADTTWEAALSVPPRGNTPVGVRFKYDDYQTDAPTVEFTYEDREDLPLESQIGTILYRLCVEAGKVLQINELNNRNRKKREEEAAYRKKLKPFIDSENEKVTKALKDANAYRDALTIREYAQAYYDKNYRRFQTEPELEDYYHWLLKRADWVDPLIENDYDALLNTNQQGMPIS